MSKKIYIGIDTGSNTGIAIWSQEENKLIHVETVKIHRAMKIVEAHIEQYGTEKIVVRFEDARLRKWYGNSGREKLQGAGSVKRDAVIWQDFLAELGVENKAIAPANNTTKMSADQFKRITGWTGKTNEHGRDAAWLVYGI